MVKAGLTLCRLKSIYHKLLTVMIVN